MIQAVIFDCFGVLVSEGWLPFKNHHFGHDAALTREASDISKSLNAGLIDYTDFLTQIGELSGMAPGEVDQEISKNKADTQLLSYIAKLKPRYKIGMLSNAGSDMLGKLFTPEQISLFDATVLSYQIGAVKPQPDAYQAIADSLGVSLSECVFVDDQERYCTGALNVGMEAIVFSDTTDCIARLDEILAA